MNSDFTDITTALSTLISQYITNCLPATLQLQKLIKEFFFYIYNLYYSSKFVEEI